MGLGQPCTQILGHSHAMRLEQPCTPKSGDTDPELWDCGAAISWDQGTPFHVNGTSLHSRTGVPLSCGVRAPSYPGIGTPPYPGNRVPHTMGIGQTHIPETPISWDWGTPILQDQGTLFHGTGTAPHPWGTPRPWNWCTPMPQQCDPPVSWGMGNGNTLELGYPTQWEQDTLTSLGPPLPWN